MKHIAMYQPTHEGRGISLSMYHSPTPSPHASQKHTERNSQSAAFYTRIAELILLSDGRENREIILISSLIYNFLFFL